MGRVSTSKHFRLRSADPDPLRFRCRLLAPRQSCNFPADSGTNAATAGPELPAVRNSLSTRLPPPNLSSTDSRVYPPSDAAAAAAAAAQNRSRDLSLWI